MEDRCARCHERGHVIRGLRLATMRAVAFTVLASILFGLVGALLSLRDYPTYSATLQMRTFPDPTVGGAEPMADVSVEEFLAGELLLLNDDTEAAATATTDDDSVTVTQIGSTNVLQVVALADTRRGAVAGAQAVAERYAAARERGLEQRVTTVGVEVQAQLAATTERIRGLTGDDVTVGVDRDALTAEYTRLLGIQNSLRIATASSQRLVQVLRDASVPAARQVVDPVRSGAAFGVLGAVLGLGAALALSRWRRWVTGLDDLLELAPELALPTIPTLGRPTTAQLAQALGMHVSALTGPDGVFAGSALLVVAPTEGAGCTTTAVGLALASARRGPTVLVAMADALDGAAAQLLGMRGLEGASEGRAVPTPVAGLSYLAPVQGRGPAALLALEDVTGGWSRANLPADVSVVIDAPALSRSPVALDVARNGGQVLLVGGVEHTTSAELQAAAAALRHVGARLTGVVLSSPRRGFLRRRPAAPSSPPVRLTRVRGGQTSIARRPT
jgi:Mrp family chromosome partitioning ATPase